MSDEAQICDPGGKGGLLLPLGDHDWPRGLRAVLYAIAMVYSFLGVAIVADMFMSAIEAITKRRKRKKLKGGTVVTVYVWNDTVANLSLMALGSSAPEIFLSLIDLLRNGLHASELGAATIVGSAAFNLLAIIAVCIMSIPADETRLIEQYSVFIVTGVVSLFAYVWLAFILVVWTPNVVEIWEALVTLFLLPLLIWVSYIADIGVISCGANWVIGERALEEGHLRKSSAKRFSRTFGTQAVAGDPADGSGDVQQERHSPKAGHAGSEKATTFSVTISENDLGGIKGSEGEACDVGDEGACKLEVRSIYVKSRLKLTSSARSISASSFHSSKSGRLSQGPTRVKPQWSKKQLTRGFSAASVRSHGTDETTAKSYLRRKSIAAHHNSAVKRFVKKHNAQIGLGSQCSINTMGTFSGRPARSGYLESEADEYSGSSTTVSLLIDRMFVSPTLKTKSLTLLRSGTPSASLRVEYTVSTVKSASECLIETQVQCSRHPVMGAPPGQTRDRSEGNNELPKSSDRTEAEDEVVEWLHRVETEEETRHHMIVVEDAREAQLVVENPSPSSKGCLDYIVTLQSVELTEVPEGPAVTALLGRVRSTYVISDPMNDPRLQSGMFSFGAQTMTISGRSHKQGMEAVVIRHCGCMNRVQVHWTTEALTAVADVDYVESSGVLTFEEGCSEQLIPLSILKKHRGRITRTFLVVLTALEEDPNEHQPLFNEDDDGGEDSAILTVFIGEHQDNNLPLKKAFDRAFNTSHLIAGFSEWADNIFSAWLVGGSWEEQKEASVADWLWHFACLPWSIIFSLVPPTSFFGGWVCFFACLVFIGAVTGIIADLAELFGCVCNVPDIITAITFVALGTSMPDLFASKTAAMEDPTADASVVNVTGSNAVNVFLGLGFPWTVAAFYWTFKPRDAQWMEKYPEVAVQYPGENCVFAVPSANLGFSIVSFCCACFGALIILILRRRLAGGELGGPWSTKVSSAFVLVAYWFGYVAVVSWRSLRYGDASTTEELAICGGLFCLECGFTLIPFVALRLEAKRLQQVREEEEAAEREAAVGTLANEQLSSHPSTQGSVEHDTGTPRLGKLKGSKAGIRSLSEMPAIPDEPPVQPFSKSGVYKDRAMGTGTAVVVEMA